MYLLEIYVSFQQILILKREKGTLLRCFKAEWQTKWVPAIIKFAESYTKKSSAAVDVRDYGINLAISVCNSIDVCIYRYRI